MAARAGLRKFRFLGFNPCWAGGDRLAEICLQTANMDVVALAGTQQRARQSERPLVSRVEGRVVLERHWGSSPFTNRSCGCSLVLGHKYRQKDILWYKDCAAAPGRSLAMRVKRGTVDFCCGVLYFPPRPQVAANHDHYKKLVGTLTSWWDEVLSALPQRCCPVFYADMNDGMGLCRRGNNWTQPATSAVRCRTRERLRDGPGEKARALLDKHFMVVANLQGEVAEPTYYGDGGSSCIDMVFAPAGVLDRQLFSSVLPRLGAKLQAFKGPPPRDHLPVYMEFVADRLAPFCSGGGGKGQVGP